MIEDIVRFVQTKAVWLVMSILTFSVLSSKHIIIYNEEILVALNFFAFVWFTAHYYGQDIQTALDQRGIEASQGLRTYITTRGDFLQLCKQEYEKQLNFANQIRTLSNFSTQEMMQAAIRGETCLNQTIPGLVLPKLQYFSSIQTNAQQDLQRQIALHFCQGITETYRSAPITVRISLVTQAIRKLERL